MLEKGRETDKEVLKRLRLWLGLKDQESILQPLTVRSFTTLPYGPTIRSVFMQTAVGKMLLIAEGPITGC